MGGRIGRRTPFTVNNVSFEIDHHHIVDFMVSYATPLGLITTRPAHDR
jgi:hypothetical protein